MAQGDSTHIAAAAWHEAGHALAAMREGRTVILAEICRHVPGSGRTVHFPFRRLNRFNPLLGTGDAKASWRDTLDRNLAEVRILLAGTLAEAKALNQSLRAIGADYDLATCHRIARRLSNLHDFVVLEDRLEKISPEELMNEERARVRRWLGRPDTWRAVCTIAATLMERRRIGSAEVIRAYLEARSELQRPLDLDWEFLPQRER